MTTPENFSAAERRDAWFHDEILGYGPVHWDYGDEITEILAEHFQVIEMMLGKDNVAPHLFAMLPGPDIEGDTWEYAFSQYHPSISLSWDAAKMLDEAGIYGLYGVTPQDIPLSERAAWIDALDRRLAAFIELVHPKPAGAIMRITGMARSRRAMDVGQGEVDLTSLALFGGVSEGRMRNILSASAADFEKVGQNVSAASASAWLKGRKEYFASIWMTPDEVLPEAASLNFDDIVVFVPVAADGSIFHPGLVRNGHFKIGGKGEEVEYTNFDEALAALQQMSTPRWRRPNEAGNLGIVSGRDWKRVERSALFHN